MKKNIFKIFGCAVVIFSTVFCVFTQTTNLIRQTTYKTETADFGPGGTLTVVGAPQGFVSVEGWNKNEVEVTAEIEVQAQDEADLAELSKINGFVLDTGFGHIRVLTVGTHDKDYMKRTAKKFPKRLLDIPFKINYQIKVPAYCDLEIDAGKGNLTISKVEGAMQLRVLEGDAVLNLTGGAVNGTFGNGNVDVNIETRSWRGRQAAFQVASGNLNVKMPQNSSADINASILRTGSIENNFTGLKPRDRSKFTDKQITARAGNGGVTLSFTVGDGKIVIRNS